MATSVLFIEITLGEYLLAKFQLDELLCSTDTERVRAVTKRTAPRTHCQRALPAKFQFVGEPIEQRMSLPEAKQHSDPLMFPVWL